MTETEVYEQFLKIETELNLFDKKIDGIFFWKLIRQKVFMQTLVSSGNLNSRLLTKSSRITHIKKLLNIILNVRFSIFYNSNRNTKAIFFEHPRKIESFNSGWLDPYSHYYIENYKMNGKEYEIVDEGNDGKHYEPAGGKRFFSDNLFYDIFYKLYLRRFSFIKKDVDLILKIEKEINLKLGTNVSIRRLAEDRIKSFKLQFEKYNHLFANKKKLEQIFIVASYGKEGLIHAAQSRMVEVIELQHGVIGKRQLGYNFVGVNKVPYFPDRFFLFGPFWKDEANLPVHQVKIDYIGFQHLEKGVRDNDISNKEKKVLVISTPGNVKDIIPAMLNLAKSNVDYQFVYRLHPKERGFDLVELYPDFYEAINTTKNISIEDIGIDLYKSLSVSTFVFGVSSTALFEALMFDVKVILVQSSGIEVMNSLIESKNVFLLDDCFDLTDIDMGINPIDKTYMYSCVK